MADCHYLSDRRKREKTFTAHARQNKREHKKTETQKNGSEQHSNYQLKCSAFEIALVRKLFSVVPEGLSNLVKRHMEGLIQPDFTLCALSLHNGGFFLFLAHCNRTGF